jgi:polysaccharide biosynthesis transport protein
VLAMAGSFLLGMAWMVTRELLTGARSGAGPNSAPGGGSDTRRPLAPSTGGMEPAFARAIAARVPAVAATAALKEEPVELAATSDTGETRLASIDKVAARLIAASATQAGLRTMVAPESRLLDVSSEAIELVKAIAASGKQVVLVDWSLDGTGFSAALGVPNKPGMTDLLQGDVSFEDVITRVPGSEAHFIACGEALLDPAMAEDADRLNLVLDALDEAYDHIVVAGNHDQSRALFQTIEGRFDAGVAVSDPKRRQPLIEDEPGSFLGFEVSDLDVIRLERSEVSPVSAPAKKPIFGRSTVTVAPAELRT